MRDTERSRGWAPPGEESLTYDLGVCWSGKAGKHLLETPEVRKDRVSSRMTVGKGRRGMEEVYAFQKQQRAPKVGLKYNVGNHILREALVQEEHMKGIGIKWISS